MSLPTLAGWRGLNLYFLLENRMPDPGSLLPLAVSRMAYIFNLDPE